MQGKKTIAASLILLATLLGGCGEPAPTDAWNANLDANCQPQDPVDWLRANISSEKFWAEQVKDMEARVRAAALDGAR